MNTPAHLIFGAAAFGRPEHRWTLVAALAGGLAPDLSLYLMVGWHLLVLGTDLQVVFGQLYYSDAWQRVFAVDNSMILWGLMFALALWRNWRVLIAFAGAGLLHIGLDFLLHACRRRAGALLAHQRLDFPQPVQLLGSGPSCRLDRPAGVVGNGCVVCGAVAKDQGLAVARVIHRVATG